VQHRRQGKHIASIIDVISGKATDARKDSEYSIPGGGSNGTLFKGLVSKKICIGGKCQYLRLSRGC
jgi:hypothetical protein